MSNRTHLGDSVYVSFDGSTFMLSTQRFGHIDRIYLDQQAMEALFQYRDQMHRLLTGASVDGSK